jgi:hypothetical protein
MIVRASGLGMGIGRFSRLLRGVGVLAMPDAGWDTTRRIESVCVRGCLLAVIMILDYSYKMHTYPGYT